MPETQEQEKEPKVDVHDKLVDMIDKPSWKSILMETVKSESMDPWNIDVGLLAKKYVEKVTSMHKLNFRVPANAVLAAAIIVRFKSDNWDLSPKSLFDDELEDQTEWEYILDGERVPELSTSRRITTRTVTIEELIKAVEDVMEKERKKAQRKSMSDIRPIPEVLMDIAFEDNEEFEDMIDVVYEKVLEKKDNDNLVLFSSLLEKGTKEEVIRTLLPLLHLATQQKLFLWQENHFKEIFISVIEENDDGRGRKENS